MKKIIYLLGITHLLVLANNFIENKTKIKGFNQFQDVLETKNLEQDITLLSESDENGFITVLCRQENKSNNILPGIHQLPVLETTNKTKFVNVYSQEYLKGITKKFNNINIEFFTQDKSFSNVALIYRLESSNNQTNEVIPPEEYEKNNLDAKNKDIHLNDSIRTNNQDIKNITGAKSSRLKDKSTDNI